MMQIRCPECSQKLNAPEAYVGREIRCPKCRHPFRVPNAAGVAVAAPPDNPPSRDEYLEIGREIDNTPEPPRSDIYGGSDGLPSRRVEEPSYSWLFLLAQIYAGLGWVVLIIGVIVVLLAFTQGQITGRSVFVLVVTTLGFLVWAITLLAIGEGLKAFRDIARNSWHWRSGGAR